MPSYQLIPGNEFDAVIGFLAKWWHREAPEKPVPEILRVHQNRLLDVNRRINQTDTG
jgi:hypothetical protein